MAKSFKSIIKPLDAPTPAAAPGKRLGRPSSSDTPIGSKLVSFHIDDDLVAALADEVHDRSRPPAPPSSQRAIINLALRQLLAPRLKS